MTSLRSSRNRRSLSQDGACNFWLFLLFELFIATFMFNSDGMDDGDTIAAGIVDDVSCLQVSCWGGIAETIYEL